MKKVVLLSGGIDSTTCLAQAVQVCGAENVTALCVFYGQKHRREMAAARKVAAYYGVRLLEQDIAGIMSYSNCSLLAASSEAIEHKSYAQQLAEHGEGTVATYVPFRNGLLISAAAAIAISLGADAICLALMLTMRLDGLIRIVRRSFMRLWILPFMKAAVNCVIWKHRC